jgi:dienelactone hydrolase
MRYSGFLIAFAMVQLIGVSLAQTPQSSGGAAPPVAAQTNMSTPSRTWAGKPADISFEPVDFYSEGVRLQGQVIYAAANQGRRLPTIVSATGWGGQANSFRAPAVEFARAGYAVFLFDYRGWGGSDGRVILTSPSRADGAAPGSSFTAGVQELRSYVDPWEQATDWFNAISFVSGQPWADPERIGVRGASFSGGHVVYVAAHDPRVKAVASLIGAFDGSPENWIVDAGQPATVRKERELRETRLASGERSAFPAPGQATFSGLRGSAPGADLSRWDAADSAYLVTAPTLFVLAGEEELFDNRKHGIRACNEVKGPRKMVLVPDTRHYDIYGIEGDLATKATIDWFDTYLLPGGQATRAAREALKLPAAPERGSCSAPFVRTPGSVRQPGAGSGYRGPPPQ